ncbi:MAG: DNA cytosine methyltransferase [Deltaproteobacteria bacterium]|nr:DNA cytosine methyltransferase [Deltaproteobacteria bacterium]
MNGLALCAGIGGIELGLALAVPQYRTVGYIECDPFAADVLAARMRDGLLPDAPIWSHVETWDSSPWIGNIEIISAGFPCQPWSVAGRKRGINDERWIWRHISRTVREVRPQYVFLENVVGLLNTGIGHVLRDLAQSGYDAEWDVFSAQDCGAPHLRKRAFVLAYARSINLEQLRETAEARIGQLGDTGLLGFKGPFRQDCHSSERLPTWPPGPDELDQWEQVVSIDPTLEPTLCGMADGVAMGLEQSACQNRKERIRALGNAVVPVVAAVAFLTLARRAEVRNPRTFK